MSPSRSAQAAENPDFPTSPTPGPAPTTSTSQLFTPIPSSPPSSSETSDEPSHSQAGDETSWSTTGPNDPYSAPDAPSDTPSTGSSVRLSKAGLRSALGTGFRQACRMLAAFVAIEEEREFGVWDPDEEDIADVARPAANLVYRRLPDEAKGGDVIDLFALGVALVAYLGKNLQRRSIVRTHLRMQAEQGIDVSAGAADATPTTFPFGGS